MSRDGLLIDWGGVLTTSVFGSFERFCRAEGLSPSAVRERFVGDPEARELLIDLERGKLAEAEFEPRFAALLGVSADGLIARLFAGLQPDPAVIAAVRAARDAGVRTGLLSNSWGAGTYDRELLPELFDVTVISGELGMRKPEPEIYVLAADRLGLPPGRIVFVDDIKGNLAPARAIGMATVHHTDAARTIGELEAILGVPL